MTESEEPTMDQLVEDLEYLIDEGLVYKSVNLDTGEEFYGLTDLGALTADYTFNHNN